MKSLFFTGARFASFSPSIGDYEDWRQPFFRDYIQHNRQGVHPIDTDDFDNKSYCYIFPDALSGDYVSEQAVAGPGYVIYIWTEDRI